MIKDNQTMFIMSLDLVGMYCITVSRPSCKCKACLQTVYPPLFKHSSLAVNIDISTMASVRPREVQTGQGLNVGLHTPTFLDGNSYLSWFYDRGQ